MSNVQSGYGGEGLGIWTLHLKSPWLESGLPYLTDPGGYRSTLYELGHVI